jgi:secreted trypsin-like serine protease
MLVLCFWLLSVAAFPAGALPQIAGGKEAAEFSLPFMAAIVNARSGQWCGATIIGKKHALTAAHCVDSSNSQGGSNPYAVQAWRHDLSIQAEQERPSHAAIMASNHIVAVRCFNNCCADCDGHIAHDIAILELEREYPAEVYSKVRPNQDKTLEDKNGLSVTVSGWGATRMDGTRPANRLQTVDLNIATDCKMFRKLVTDHQVCASTPNKGSCFGDSGGPLYKESNGQYLILGVVSFGGTEEQLCANPDYPGVYASIAHPDHYSWIHSVTHDILISGGIIASVPSFIVPLVFGLVALPLH